MEGEAEPSLRYILQTRHIVYTVTNCVHSNQNREKINTGFLHIQQSFAREKCNIMTCVEDIIDDAVKIKDDTTLCQCQNQWRNRR